MAGTLIGAGVFSLPYIFKTAGLASGFFYLALGAVVYICVYWMFAEVILKTPGKHRFVGYARIYLGKWASEFAILMTIVQILFVLTIYLVLSQSFANLITEFGDPVEKMIVFWFLGSISIFLSLRKIAWLEFLITIGIIAIFLMVFVLGLPKMGNLADLDLGINFGKVLLPLSAILFSLAGRQAVPAMVDISPKVKLPVVLGVAIPAAVYGLFVISVLAISPTVSEDAVSGLISQISPGFTMAIGILGILSLLSSYIIIGFDVYKSLQLDLKFHHWLSFAIVFFGPMALYLAGFSDFIALVSFTGGIFLALEGIFIIWIWLKATKKRLSLPIILLLLVFATALVYEIIK
jgi:amino acid permease